MSYQLINKTFCLQSTRDIQEICTSLKRYEINYFSFTRLYNDKTFHSFSTRDDWIQHFIAKNYTILADRETKLYPKQDYFLWSTMEGTTVNSQQFIDARELFNIGHGISFVERKENHCDIYNFATNANNKIVMNFYVNNVGFLKQFILHFKDKTAQFLNKIILPKSHKLSYPIINKYDYHSLTARELECVNWLIQGKTVPEIALILSISKRTVEKYIVNIKIKLDCYTLFQLGSKVNDIGLDHFLK